MLKESDAGKFFSAHLLNLLDSPYLSRSASSNEFDDPADSELTTEPGLGLSGEPEIMLPFTRFRWCSIWVVSLVVLQKINML